MCIRVVASLQVNQYIILLHTPCNTLLISRLWNMWYMLNCKYVKVLKAQSSKNRRNRSKSQQRYIVFGMCWVLRYAKLGSKFVWHEISLKSTEAFVNQQPHSVLWLSHNDVWQSVYLYSKSRYLFSCSKKKIHVAFLAYCRY